MTTIYNPTRAFITALEYSTLCYRALVTLVMVAPDGEYETRSFATDIFSENVDEVVVECYLGIRALYTNILQKANIITREGVLVGERDIQTLVDHYNNGGFVSTKNKMVH
jgi:hypothetical protein